MISWAVEASRVTRALAILTVRLSRSTRAVAPERSRLAIGPVPLGLLPAPLATAVEAKSLFDSSESERPVKETWAQGVARISFSPASTPAVPPRRSGKI